MDARHLARALGNPVYVQGLEPRGWAALLAMADAEGLTASLAWRLSGLAIPEEAQACLTAAREGAEAARSETLANIRTIAEHLAPAKISATLLDEAGWIAAGLDAARGRQATQIAIAVPAAREAEARALLQRPIRIRAAQVEEQVSALPLENGLLVPAPEAMVMGAVVALLGSGDPAGLGGLWAIDRLLREFSDVEGFWQRLHGCSAAQKCTPLLSRALRLSHHLFETPVDPWLAWEARRGDVFYLGRILARNARGEESRRILRLAFRLKAKWRG